MMVDHQILSLITFVVFLVLLAIFFWIENPPLKPAQQSPVNSKRAVRKEEIIWVILCSIVCGIMGFFWRKQILPECPMIVPLFGMIFGYWSSSSFLMLYRREGYYDMHEGDNKL